MLRYTLYNHYSLYVVGFGGMAVVVHVYILYPGPLNSIEYVLEIALQFAIKIIIEAHKNCLERLSNTVNQKPGKSRETWASRFFNS